MTAARSTRAGAVRHRGIPQPEAATQPVISGAAFRVYKWVLSPLLHAIAPARCLYLPTCSEYAYTAVVRFGLVRGSWMALRRLARCHPWAAGGLDPVPERNADRGSSAAASSTVAAPGGPDHLP